MKRRLLLTIAALITASNLAFAVVYAAQCEGRGGARACGTTCIPAPDGQCGCVGSCTAGEMNWVAAGGTKEGPVAEAELAY